ncbi:peroxisomal sarcosine oxidase-like isoform X2 [Mizuhopecten yessoensis]|uniref:Peroxisomal sarcosine oxidase n=1 Tax=Mizuhopecten yessoensis TaxID=6573 RepID=A0A210Q1U5_MIZYE|nr:peroxisomal sarcosine oxidase-like isoform X2 [Mizuhopecten yessoensis]OWF42685.1 Peroxisomal sarcosine oxidase [Mizuhopecten yessoensis]
MRTDACDDNSKLTNDNGAFLNSRNKDDSIHVMTEDLVYDVIIVGAGIVGSYTAYHAKRTGKSTLLLEQFPLPHSRGSSHGQSRTIRSAYGDLEYYTQMMTKAFRMWNELEDQSRQTLFRQTGLLCIGQKGTKYLDKTTDCLRKNKTPFRRLDYEEFNKAFPMLSYPSEVGGAVVDYSAGLLLAGRALTAVQNQYLKLGGLLHDGEKMTEIIPGEVIKVKTEARLYQAKAVVLCVGPWAKKVLTKLGLDVPLQTQKIKVCYWKEKTPGTFSSRHFPVFSQLKAIGPHLVYGVPCDEYPDLVKVCLHYGPTVDPDYRDTANDRWVEDALQKYVKEHIPGLEPYPVITESCIYTNTPDEDFVLDRHPFYNNIIIGAGFSGHGFKLAPVVGEILATMAAGKTPEQDMTYFCLNRFKKSHL